MAFTTVGPAATGGSGYEVLPSGRVARMAALEETSQTSGASPPPNISQGRGGGVHLSSSSDFGLEDSPDSYRKHTPHHRPLHPPPRGRNASLSSSSVLMDPASPLASSDKNPSSGGDYSGTQQSEQLSYFKDYYSSDDIHPGDKVATLWAYTPRAADEFELERGDMLKIVGIWDDGWATGIILRERAEDNTAIPRRDMRDSGVSCSQTSQRPMSSPPEGGEVKAFPLVCVCLPEHWQKTIESEVQGSDFPDFSDGQTSSPEQQSGRRVGEKSSSRFKDDLNVPRSPASSSP